MTDPSVEELPENSARWLVEALRLLRTAEAAPGPDGRGVLRALHRVGSRATLLGLPWCGLFVGHCLQAARPDLALPRFHARARPWARWGQTVPPQLGAVMLFWHYHPRAPFGHVAFYWAEDEGSYHVISGNQDTRIQIQRYPRSRLVTCRWPEGEPETQIRRPAPPGAAAPFG